MFIVCWTNVSCIQVFCGFLFSLHDGMNTSQGPLPDYPGSVKRFITVEIKIVSSALLILKSRSSRLIVLGHLDDSMASRGVLMIETIKKETRQSHVAPRVART